MKQAVLIERYTTFTDKKGKAVTRSETVLILTTASPGQAPSADLLAFSRGYWAATEAHPLHQGRRHERGLLQGTRTRRGPVHGNCQ